MVETEETKKCPYCSELILVSAKKCKHCSEWLEESKERKGSSWDKKGSVDARAITKGLKEKEQDDFNQKWLMFGVLVVAVLVGYGASSLFKSSTAGWIIGFITLIAGGVWVTKEYFEE